MAEKAEKKAEAPAAGHDKKEGEKAAGGGGMGAMLGKTPVMLGVAMFLEAVVLFAGFKFIGGGAPTPVAATVLSTGEEAATEEAPAEGGSHGEAAPAESSAPAKEAGGHGAPAKEGGGEATPAAGPHKKGTKIEVPVVEMRAPNKTNGRQLLVDVSIFAVVKVENEARVKDQIKSRDAMIRDRVRTIIAQSDPEKLGGSAEPGLETLRRQVKYVLDEIVGEGQIDEVLVPKCIPVRTD